jgi:tetratricopeptide (TPR) repeat protein
MKKIILIIATIFCLYHAAYSQRVLDYRDQTQALSVFSDKDPEVINAGGAQSGITVFCTNTLSLSFESNVDRTVDVYNREDRGGLTYYYIRFTVGRFRGSNYDGRVLEVLAPGFLPLKIRLDLQPSESKSFEIYDPNATVGVGCFYENFNSATLLFRNSQYNEAKEKFNLSKECTDYQEGSNVAYILEAIDSILYLRARGDYYFEAQNYNEAYNAYQKAVGYNSSDVYALGRRNEASAKINELCTNYFHEAESYFYQRKYKEAEPLYEKMLALSCSKNREANLRLLEMRKYLTDRRQKAQVILYEYAENTPFGLSYGKYTPMNFSTYISLRLNLELFEAISKKHEADSKPEINLSFGWNRMVIPEVGFFAGLGYTGVGKWNGEDGESTLEFYHAASPEVGALLKVGPIALRYTFQYRFALDNANQDHIGNMRHVFGIGMCF